MAWKRKPMLPLPPTVILTAETGEHTLCFCLGESCIERTGVQGKKP